MANSAIKGITIQLGADASELTTALYNTDNALKNTQKQLRQVESALKLSPNNTELLTQKMTFLGRAIEEDEKYINDLKSALSAMRARGVSESSDEFMALQREIIKAESKQESFQQKLQETTNSLHGAESATDEFGSAVSHLSTDTNKAGGALNAFSVAMGNLAAQGIKMLADAIMNQLDAAVKRVDTLHAYSRTMQNLGYTAEEAGEAQDKMVESIQTLPTALDDIVGMQQQYTALYGDIEKATDLTIALNDATLAGGQGQEQASRAMDAWYKVLAKGVPEAEQWQTLNETMPAQMNQIAQSVLGAEASSQDLFKAWQEGTVSTDQVTEALMKLDKEGGGSLASFSQQAEDASAGIGTMMTNLQTAITRGLAEVIENIGIDNIMNGIQMITDLLFGLLSAFGQVLGGLVGLATGAEGAEEQFTEGIMNMINTAVDFIITTAPQILIALATGIVKAIPLLVAAIPQILSNFKSALIASAPQLKAAGVQLLKAIITGIKSILSSLPAIGKQIVQGLWNGLKSSLSWIKSMIKGWVGNVKSFLKKLFGISSPSKWARDEIGYNIARGLAGGITQNAGLVDSAMASLLPSTDVTLGAVGTEMANAVGTGMALANTGNIGGGTYQFVINLGGVKVAEQIYRLSEQGKMVLVG